MADSTDRQPRPCPNCGLLIYIVLRWHWKFPDTERRLDAEPVLGARWRLAYDGGVLCYRSPDPNGGDRGEPRYREHTCRLPAVPKGPTP